MIKALSCCLIISTFPFVFVGCKSINEANSTQPHSLPSPTIKSEIAQAAPIVDIPKLANKSTAEFDNIFGKPETAKSIKEPRVGEYRVYKIPNHPKGLAVRFYGGKATSFNLILSKTFPTSKAALKEVFGIDVGDAPPKIDPKEPLSEVWRGEFNGVKFAKTYAKRERENGGFIFVLAEVGQ